MNERVAQIIKEKKQELAKLGLTVLSDSRNRFRVRRQSGEIEMAILPDNGHLVLGGKVIGWVGKSWL